MTYSDRQLAKTAIRMLGFVSALTGARGKVLDVAAVLASNGNKDLDDQLKALGREVADELRAEAQGMAAPLPQPAPAPTVSNEDYRWQGPATRIMD